MNQGVGGPVRAASPDGNIEATITGPDSIRITFRPGTFRRYTEASLGHQLARLGALAWVAVQRQRNGEHRRRPETSAGDTAPMGRREDARVRRYRGDLRAVTGYGRSPAGTVEVRTTGLGSWRIELARGCLRRLSEAEFLGEVHAALRTLLADRDQKITLLKARYFDLGLPAPWRELAHDLGTDLAVARSDQPEQDRLGYRVLGRRDH